MAASRNAADVGQAGEPRGAERNPSRRTLRGVDWLNFFLADVQTGLGPFLAIYLASHHWDEERVGLVLTLGGLAGVVAQTPAGALVDAVRAKRALVAAGVGALALGALGIAVFPSFGPVVLAQVLIGASSSIFIPALCAISLGIVGRAAFDARQGRNQTFNSAGNVTAALLMGALGYYVSERSVFVAVALLAIPTLCTLLLIRPTEIDYGLARGGQGGETRGTAERPWALFRDRPLVVFLLCAVLFHFANAAMLPLLGEHLAQGRGRASMLFMSACVVTTQLVITLIASWTGRRAARWGRKPLLLVGFAVLPVRGVLYTLTSRPELLVGIQVLDGIGAGIFGVVSVLVIADLTRGTGRFNLTLGAISTAVGIGASLSQVIAGSLVHHFGFRVGFLFLSAVATAALGLLAFAMPETRGSPEAAEKPGPAAKTG